MDDSFRKKPWTSFILPVNTSRENWNGLVDFIEANFTPDIREKITKARDDEGKVFLSVWVRNGLRIDISEPTE